MNVSRWMTRTLVTCTPEQSLADAAALFWQHDIGSAPVVDAERRLLGVITDRDVCMAAFTRGAPLGAHTIESAMARRVYTLAPTDSLAKAHELFRVRQLRRLPVVDAGGVLVGVLTVQDVARRTLDGVGRARRKSAALELLTTLAEIARPRTPAVAPKAAAGSKRGDLKPVRSERPPAAPRAEPKRGAGARKPASRARRAPRRAAAKAGA
jgi:CBS domain-containing protein